MQDVKRKDPDLPQERREKKIFMTRLQILQLIASMRERAWLIRSIVVRASQMGRAYRANTRHGTIGPTETWHDPYYSWVVPARQDSLGRAWAATTAR